MATCSSILAWRIPMDKGIWGATLLCSSVQLLSRVRLFAKLWTTAHQAPLSMEFSRQEYWTELPCSPPDLPNPGIKPVSLKSPDLASGFFTTSATWVGPVNTFNMAWERPSAKVSSLAMSGFLTHQNCQILNIYCFKPLRLGVNILKSLIQKL